MRTKKWHYYRVQNKKLDKELAKLLLQVSRASRQMTQNIKMLQRKSKGANHYDKRKIGKCSKFFG